MVDCERAGEHASIPTPETGPVPVAADGGSPRTGFSEISYSLSQKCLVCQSGEQFQNEAEGRGTHRKGPVFPKESGADGESAAWLGTDEGRFLTEPSAQMKRAYFRTSARHALSHRKEQRAKSSCLITAGKQGNGLALNEKSPLLPCAH